MGVNYLHINNIVHRDIKLENVLMQTDNKDDLTLKITDFGFAKLFNKGELLTDILGSPLYMAPEIIQKKSYSSAVDIWAAGVLLHILLVGEPPYIAGTKKDIFKKIKKDKVEFNNEGWNNISKDCKDMLKSIFCKDPQIRPTAAQLLNHHWIKIIDSNIKDQNNQTAI